jgi:DNA-binding transcriptional regulator LsrR (DeoR family)
MNNLSSTVNSIEWRRSRVLELASQGYNQSEISRILQISQPTINRDITYLRQQAKANIKKYVDETLPDKEEKYLRYRFTPKGQTNLRKADSYNE